MTYQEFCNTFLVQITSDYRDELLPFSALINVQLWEKLFPNNFQAATEVKWHQVKMVPFMLKDAARTGLLVYSVNTFQLPHEIKYVGIRFDNKCRQNSVLYFLRRPQYVDEHWDISYYDFDKQQEVFIQKMTATDSITEFRNEIERLPLHIDEPESLISLIKRSIFKKNTLRQMITAE